MKKFLVIIMGLILVIGLISCKKTASKPADVLTLLKESKSEEDAKAYFTKGTVKAMDELKKLMPEMKGKKDKSSIGKDDKWEVVNEDIQGDLATVTIKFTGSDNAKKVGTIYPFKFKKEDGSWKLDMEAELNMGLKMMNSLKGLDMNKMMKDAMKGLK